MKKLIFLIALLTASYCEGQKRIDEDHFFSLLDSRNYGQMLVDAHKVRKEVYGKNWLIDYFIAKAECGLGKPDVALDWYNFIFKHYKQNDKSRKFLFREINTCSTEPQGISATTGHLGMPDKSLLSSMIVYGGSVSGKMGPVSGCKVPPRPVENLRDISEEEMESRLFAIDQGESAIRKYRSMLSKSYHIDVSGRFIVISNGSSALNKEQVATTSLNLEKVYRFFTKHYDLRPPDKLLAAYLLPDQNTFQRTAELVHGIKLPFTNIGYSNITDLSLVGVCNLNQGLGTLYHELFHLMVRTDVGDISPWLDEGIACIYETSKLEGDVLTPKLENWRVHILETAGWEMPDKIPYLRDFIRYNWRQFDGLEANDICLASINYAYGKHLMLYFNQLGKIPLLITAVKNRNAQSSDGSVAFLSDADLLEQTLNSPIDTIEADFARWMEKTYHLRLYERHSAKPAATFFEKWDAFSWHIRSIPDGQAKNDIIGKYDQIKISYDNQVDRLLAEQAYLSGSDESLQLQVHGHNYKDIDRVVIAAAEAKMQGIDRLQQELADIEKQLDLELNRGK
jgi:hypothetical protein